MLKNMLTESCITLNLLSTTKNDVIDELIELLYSNGKISDKEEFKRVILRREAQSSTGLEEGIAIPHGKSKVVNEPSIAFGLSKNGIDYQSLDGEPSKLFFMIAVPENANDAHIETLSQLTTLLLDDDIREKLLNVKSPNEVLETLLKEEKNEEKEQKSEVKDNYDVLAVTACPTGIAHTYMAAEALMKKAKELGVSIKVETNGSTGIKNRLTEEEIRKAKGIIVAADKNVEMARFNGKNVEITGVKDGIKRPEELILNALNKKSPIYTSNENGGSSNSTTKGKNRIYKHLMSGVSNMLPFVVGGGILIAISFMFGINSANINDPSYNPIAKLLNDIGGKNAFSLMIPVLAGFIGMSIADRPGFAPAMVGGLIAANNNGGFLGGLIAGFLGGYVVELLKKVLAPLPEKLDGLKPVLFYPLLGIFITGALMYTIIISPVSAINQGLIGYLSRLGTTNMVLIGALLAGMMAVDMGGPINKAAFTFGIAMITAGNYYPHAAVMAGGMVPPLGIAIATTLFKNYFTEDEQKAGVINYVMGASFITEGAIPFAAADPMRIIPSCVVGAAIAGGLSMIFKCQLPAPHGGIFVLPVVTNPMMYLIAILVGSFVTAFMIGLLKKSKTN